MEKRETSYLSDKSSFLASLVLSSDDAIEGLTLDGNVIFWNKGSEELYGYSSKDILGKSILTVYPKERIAELPPIIAKLRKGEHVRPFITQRIRKDGSIVDVAVSASPIKNKKGIIIAASFISRPFAGQELITASTLEVAAVKQALHYARSLIETSLDPLVAISPEGKITDVNEATVQATGIAREKLIGSDFSNYFTEPEKAMEVYKLVFSKGSIKDYPLTIRASSGRTIDVLYNASIYKDEQGNVLGIFAAARDITERKLTEERFQNILEATPDATVMIDQEGKIIFINAQTVKLFGYKKNELIGEQVEILIPEPYRSRHPEHRKNFFKEPRSRAMGSGMELFGQRKNLEIFPIEISLAPLETKDGVVGLAAIRDITDQKQVSQYARSLIEASLDPLVTISPDGKITDVNEATVKVTGVSRDKLIGSDFSNYFTEPEEAREGYKQVFKEGFVRDYPLAIHHVSGAITHVVYNATVYRDVAGKVLGVFAAARDVTLRKKAEELQHSTSAYARSLIESSLDPLVTISPDGKITDVNHATEVITGVMREWLIGSDFSNYFTEPRKAREGYRLVLKEGSVRDYPLAIRHASSKIYDVLFNATVYRDATGNVKGVFAAARDITETKKTFLYARSLIEASLDPLVTISLAGKITDVNEATVKVTGVQRDKLIGTDFSNYFTEPEKARKGYEEVFKKGFVTDYPLTIRNQNGSLTEVLYNASVYKDELGHVLGVFAAARDYSKVKRTTMELQTSNKELDAFTYSVAHDLKAPLRGIDGFSKILIEEYAEKLDDEGKRIISTIVNNTKQMGRLIEDLLSLAHVGRDAIKKESLNVKELVTSVYNDLKSQVPNRHITLNLKELADCRADQKLLRLAWINLISNAIKFSQTNKNATIEIGSQIKQNEIIYYIKDNGLGFDMAYADKLFGVFQRLHGSEIEGTGIGLANVQRIINRHGGSVWGEGQIGEGATFSFSIPKE